MTDPETPESLEALKSQEIVGFGVQAKIGQLLMPRLDFRQGDPVPQAQELLTECAVGGFIVFGGDLEQVRRATSKLQSLSEVPLIFAVDAERGLGQTVEGASVFPHIMSIAACQDPDFALLQGRFTAKEMSYAGLNLCFAPVVDVNANPDNPIINVRSFGDDPLAVANYASSFIRGVQEQGVAACAKHFPGHGSVNADSHVSLPVCERTLEELMECDIVPFERAIGESAASIMTAHISYPNVDPSADPSGNCATLSTVILTDLLRDRLGFPGLVITDSFHMAGVITNGAEKDAALKALNAGCDIILDPKETNTVFDELIQLLTDGSLDESTIDLALKRVLSFKQAYVVRSAPHSDIDLTESTRLREDISRRSVCVLKGRTIREANTTVYVLDALRPEERRGKVFVNKLQQNGIHCAVMRPTLDETKDIIPRADIDDHSICLIYTGVGAWTQATVLPPQFRDLLIRISKLPLHTTLVSFGSPYALRGMGDFDTIIAAFDGLSEIEAAAADILTGALKSTAKMPVRIEL